MITLYHGEPNLFALKPLIALEEGDVAYQSRPIAQLPLETAVPGYPAETAQAINVEREGPVLVEHGVMITGSFFLLEYLAETRPELGLLPADPLARYTARGIGQTVANMVAPFVVGLGLARYPIAGAAPDYAGIDPVERREAWIAAHGSTDATGHADRLRPTIAKLEKLLEAGGEWFLCSFSIVDIDVFAVLRNLPDLAPGLVDGGDTPRLAALLARMEQRPSVLSALARATHAHPERVFAPGPEISRWG